MIEQELTTEQVNHLQQRCVEFMSALDMAIAAHWDTVNTQAIYEEAVDTLRRLGFGEEVTGEFIQGAIFTWMQFLGDQRVRDLQFNAVQRIVERNRARR